MNAFEYITADNFAAATEFLAENAGDGVLVKAGGIDVLDRLKERTATPQRVLNLCRARDGGDRIEVREGDGEVVIPALATVAEVAEHADVRRLLPALAQAAEHAATPQIRNVATVGGNLCQKPRCWYFRSRDFHCLKKGGGTCYAVRGDNRYHAIFGAGACHIVHPSNLAVALLACAGRVHLVRHKRNEQVERVVALDEFFRVPPNPMDDENTLEPGELIKHVSLPLEPAGPRSAYIEVREKQSFDWPLVSCAANLNGRDEPRIVLGAVAPIPWRLAPVEKLIASKELDDNLLAEARGLAAQDARPMPHNAYKVQLVGVAVERALRQANETT
jgi:xanthine dehydrogenase YagS FAD-binding subunit